MKNFAITGVAGYIAPRHLQAIKATGNQLVAAVDTHDSVGVLDRYFQDVSFFTEFERFDRHLEKLKRLSEEERVHYVSICSPNFLHDAHMRFALRIGADAICEKPLVLNPWNLDSIQEMEKETGHRVNTVLQLRVHPALLELKNKIANSPKKEKHEVLLTYITSRGLWYNYSWKGVKEKSGGVATNIGVHFYDFLMWLFGSVKNSSVYLSEFNKMSGFLELENANVRWFLSIDKNDLPAEAVKDGKTTYRSITIDGDEVEFTNGFTELHTKIYEEVLKGNGFGIDDARAAIELVYQLRNAKLESNLEYAHPFLTKGK
jgi:UDP-N-acetyl-2-amino-2-deoxyglucuronate dehydrogenase